jgi:hypothetical protein
MSRIGAQEVALQIFVEELAAVLEVMKRPEYAGVLTDLLDEDKYGVAFLGEGFSIGA